MMFATGSAVCVCAGFPHVCMSLLAVVCGSTHGRLTDVVVCCLRRCRFGRLGTIRDLSKNVQAVPPNLFTSNQVEVDCFRVRCA